MTQENSIQYRKLFDDTVVAFCPGHIDIATGLPDEWRLDRSSCLGAIEHIRHERASYATEEAYKWYLEMYIGAARFMGWLEQEEKNVVF